jgi:ABC-2 type transport system ATP-binding protein
MLSLDNVRRAFGGVQAVRGISFTVERGSTFGLLGPNGAGKTTTMRMILGILAPDSGAISWDGRRVDQRVRRRFGYLPEERGLYGSMRVGEQIAFFARLHGFRRAEAARRSGAWIERLGLERYATRRCAELSKGNQQKVQLACAAAHDPELLVLDEPFSGLDPLGAEALLAVLAALKRHGTALILSSHQLARIEELCDALCIVGGGEVRARGTLAELRERWETRIVRVAPASPRVRAVFERLPFGAPADHCADVLTYRVPARADLSQLLHELAAAETLTRFERLEPSLHEIYLRAIGA